ncbi:MAG: YkgJ family cysteine cluster protein [Deltaproteobacteria bacterium]|nr:YkgJ family cysteine cluster protein [Deltaproteobacteria bacterium]MBW1920241.1 YkgJ family cysteine cluster protein [Deltaproteobacteria bacterium]MBW1936251.1 YkgJ family cysteine cluster protein [Deltaproteobacteria bacterium]MBW1979303.1 YkgJ family cysteine cluster protein [Deltaproteobacteria bacterium]MBW2044202.1 YkgJ family cysteine cluster protein [Deltaproteobacteria bacterium]
MKAFDCKMCGDCCYGEGGIVVHPEEIQAISKFLGIIMDSFVQRFCYKKNGKTYIRSGEDGYCVFYDEKRKCLIHPVKPSPCSMWPFYRALLTDKDNWELAKEACPGINPESSFDDFVRQSKARQEESAK